MYVTYLGLFMHIFIQSIKFGFKKMPTIAITAIVASGRGSKNVHSDKVYMCTKFDACIKMCTDNSHIVPTNIQLECIVVLHDTCMTNQLWVCGS